jgi:hypothetical protein
MKTETPVIEPLENEISEKEELKIRKVTVGAFEVPITFERLGSELACGTCSNTGCSTYLICSEGCHSVPTG